ncbi:MAG: Hpt domain-containing protein [Defluviitaleaceae bacterium]|nr:Hpt domain-containing protein [Defluviitaleaceae bacterium]
MIDNLNREQAKLRRDFVKSQKYTLRDLQAEISAHHFATAHRLVHTLKGNASLIEEQRLTDIALKVEQQLKSKTVPIKPDMEVLESELNRVLAEITDSGVMNEDTINTPPTAEEQTALFNKLEALLQESDAASTELLSELSLIPETKVLIRQIENFAFKPALVTLEVLREVLGY